MWSWCGRDEGGLSGCLQIQEAMGVKITLGTSESQQQNARPKQLQEGRIDSLTKNINKPMTKPHSPTFCQEQSVIRNPFSTLEWKGCSQARAGSIRQSVGSVRAPSWPWRPYLSPFSTSHPPFNLHAQSA